MRLPVLAMLALALGACQSEPDFDERYSDAEQKIRKTASDIDGQLKSRKKKAEEADSRVTPKPPRKADPDPGKDAHI